MSAQLQVRVQLPDRPGSLGRLAGAFGAAGADIVAVQVLEREQGVAIDDFIIECPANQPWHVMLRPVSALPGVRVLGVRDAVDAPGYNPGLDLLGHVAASPERGLATLIDMAPVAFAADWAAAIDMRSGETPTIVRATHRAPADWLPPSVTPIRPTAAVGLEGEQLVLVPLAAPGAVLVLARTDGLAFHPVEVARVARVVELATTITTNAERYAARG